MFAMTSIDFLLSQHPEWLHWLDTCPSTNSWAIAQLPQLSHGDVIFTTRQTAGRGQSGRLWQSPPGVLTASFVLHNIPPAQLSGLSLMVGLAVIDTLVECSPELSPVLGWKWANDVLIDGKKLAGILCEGVTPAGRNQASVVVGIGINRQVEFNSTPVGDDLRQRATSWHDWVTEVPGELLILERLRGSLLDWTSRRSAHRDLSPSESLALILLRLRQRDALLGKFISLECGRKTFSGEAVGISDLGHLRLKLASGEIRSFAAGHILW
jgi:BirA family transcriptional regulator, biotin operon repressor / biotin---[acetyl-CoA-carboxylase] ligase